MKIPKPDGEPRFRLADGMDLVDLDVLHFIVTPDEIKALDQVKRANPYYFKALVAAASLIPDRRAKYSGDFNPFYNFQVLANAMSIPVYQAFTFYREAKRARLLATPDANFRDERIEDTLLDLANYTLLQAAWVADGASIEKDNNLDLLCASIDDIKGLLDELLGGQASIEYAYAEICEILEHLGSEYEA